MATNNRYPPHFKVFAVSEYQAHRAKYSDEPQGSSLRIVASKLEVPESTLAGWIRLAAAESIGSGPDPTPERAAPKAGRERGRFLDIVAVIISLAAAAQSWIGFQPLRDTQEQDRNARNYFEAVTAPNPASFGALVTRLETALNYTEQDSPAARVLALGSEVARVAQDSKATIEETKGSTVTRIDGGYRACRPDDPADCREYRSLEFDERNRLRTYSLGDVRLQSVLLNREEASSQNDDVKVNLIDGVENQDQVTFAAEVTNQRAGEIATLDFAGARYAAGDERFKAEVAGPSTLGPNESVTIAGQVDHVRGVTLSVPVIFRDDSGNGAQRATVLLIKLN